MGWREDLPRAVAALERGGLVAFPTETVYGLGADAASESAVRRVFAAKGRPPSHPLIVHLPSAEQVDEWATDVPELARELGRAFWPGPLTLVLRRGPRVADAVTAGLPTVGLRVPSHPVAAELLAAFGGALAAPSANRFGAVSATTAEHVRDLGDMVDVVLDAGPCPVGIESTIVDLSGEAPRLLRPGGISREDLERVAGRSLPPPAAGEQAVRAPGTLPSHYSPRALVVDCPGDERIARARAMKAQLVKAAVLMREGEEPPPQGIDAVWVPADLEGFARELYRALREADARGFDALLVTLPEEGGLGTAIADRLRRAAASR